MEMGQLGKPRELQRLFTPNRVRGRPPARPLLAPSLGVDRAVVQGRCGLSLVNGL